MKRVIFNWKYRHFIRWKLVQNSKTLTLMPQPKLWPSELQFFSLAICTPYNETNLFLNIFSHFSDFYPFPPICKLIFKRKALISLHYHLPHNIIDILYRYYPPPCSYLTHQVWSHWPLEKLLSTEILRGKQ